MEEEEIELWYEEEKQKLSEKFIKEIDKGVSVEKRAQRFNKAFERLTAEYDRKHAKFRAKSRNKERRKKLLSRLAYPFVMAGRSLRSGATCAGGLVSKSTRDKASTARFHFSLLWTRKSYKVPQFLGILTRPVYYKYVKYLQPAVILLLRPLRKFRRWLARNIQKAVDALQYVAGTAWGGIKKTSKVLFKLTRSVLQSIVGKIEERNKRYTEWYKKKVQERTDRIQARKEARSKRKEERLKRREAKISASTETDQKVAKGEPTGIAETPAV